MLILRDVLGFSARETADSLDMNPAAVDSAMQRAKKTVEARLPPRSQQATLRSLDDAELRAIVDGYMEAWERADVDALAAMLAEQAVFTMPPQPTWFRGRDEVGLDRGDGRLALDDVDARGARVRARGDDALELHVAEK